MNEERTLWKGPSSPVINVGAFLLCILALLLEVALLIAFWGMGSLVRYGLLGVMLVPLGVGLWKWFENRCRVYEVTSQRIKISQGVLSVRTDELELYRVKDITTEQPLTLRVFGLANIILTTNDTTTPTLVLEAIPKAIALREELRTSVEACREQKKVRLAELE
jgi:membrane protein YdbS with pleckstrin-like domain